MAAYTGARSQWRTRANRRPLWQDALALAIAIGVSQLAGVIGSLGAGDGMTRFYMELELPPLTPPSSVFGPVWISLYTLTGISAWLVWREGWQARRVKPALIAFVVQLALNAGWTIVFFGLNALGWAIVEILVLVAAILVTTVLFWKVRPLAGVLLLPYLAWTTFATYLTIAIWYMN
jgi:tryptophan-rich sensory protein